MSFLLINNNLIINQSIISTIERTDSNTINITLKDGRVVGLNMTFEDFAGKFIRDPIAKNNWQPVP